MSKHDEADLILKLYDLRREEVMRTARDWFFREFNPQSFADVKMTMFGEHGGHLRMVVSYWDMAAALVNNGAISLELFTETNGEYLGVFAKVEPLLGEIRSSLNPRFLSSVEKLIDDTPGGREQVEDMRQRMKAIMAEMAGKQARAAN